MVLVKAKTLHSKGHSRDFNAKAVEETTHSEPSCGGFTPLQDLGFTPKE